MAGSTQEDAFQEVNQQSMKMQNLEKSTTLTIFQWRLELQLMISKLFSLLKQFSHQNLLLLIILTHLFIDIMILVQLKILSKHNSHKTK